MSEIDRYSTYEYDGDEIITREFINIQEDPLIENIQIKQEIQIKSEPEDYVETNQDEKEVYVKECQIIRNDKKSIIRKSNRKKKNEMKEQSNHIGSDSSKGEILKKKTTEKNKKINQVKETIESKKTNKCKETNKCQETNKSDETKEKYLNPYHQKRAEIKVGLVHNFLSGEKGLLNCVEYKGVELRRKEKGVEFSVKDEDLYIFRRDSYDKISYNCDDCIYTTEQLSKFKLHFILHANNHYIMGIINQIKQAFYCYICKKNCLSDQELNQHLQKHPLREKITKPKSKTELKKIEELPSVYSPLCTDDDDNIVDDNIYNDDNINNDDNVNNDANTDDEIPLSNYVAKDDIKDIIESGKMKLEVEFTPEICLENKSEIVVKEEKEMNYSLDVEFKENHIYDECKLDYADDKSLLKLKCEEVSLEQNAGCMNCGYRAEPEKSLKHNCKLVRECDLCNKILISQRVYRYHRKSHFCDKCPFQSKNLDDVTKHKRDSLECWSKCDKCDFKTMSIEYFQKHKREGTCFKTEKYMLKKSEEKLTCNVCPFETFYKHLLENHLKQHQNGDKYVCKICNVSSPNKRALHKHILLHNCRKCSFVAAKFDELIQHRKDNPSCVLKCKYCHFSSVFKSAMTTHMSRCQHNKEVKTKKNYAISLTLQCDLCNYKTNSFKHFEKHEAKHSNPKPYHCKLCDYTSKYKENVNTHEKTHIVDKMYQCTLCNYECSRLKSFETHKKMHGIDGNKLPEKTGSSERDPRFVYCDKCEYRTKHSYQLKYHMKKHDDVAAHLCPHCGRSFHSLIDFHVHKQTHKERDLNAKRKVFKCSYCDYSHYLKSSVKIHERKHTGTKPYSCNVCSYTTSYAGNLSAHRKKHLK